MKINFSNIDESNIDDQKYESKVSEESLIYTSAKNPGIVKTWGLKNKCDEDDCPEWYGEPCYSAKFRF